MKFKIKTVASCSPVLLCLVAGTARAALEPFSFDASETLQHESNILHADDTNRTAGWLSTTEFRAALDQAVGRDQIKGSASVNVDRYSKLHSRNSEGYTALGEFDWSSVGDLSGALGADSRRHQYLYGLYGDRASSVKNLQTDNHAFARVQLGGQSRWTISSGFDASQRTYSNTDFDLDELQQWAVNAGTSYATSPDLSFGIQGRYTRGKYPKALLGGTEVVTGGTTVLVGGSPETFAVKTVGVNTRWAPSANSSFNANVGYTQQRSDGQPDEHFINGAVNWTWTPPSHFKFTLGASRDSNTNAGAGAASILSTGDSSISARSLNTVAHFDVGYELTAKVTLDALVQYVHRKYTDALLPTGFTFGGRPQVTPVSGSSNTSSFTLSAHYAPTRTTTVGCGFTREVHSADQEITKLAGPYTDNTVMCTAAIHFD